MDHGRLIQENSINSLQFNASNHPEQDKKLLDGKLVYTIVPKQAEENRKGSEWENRESKRWKSEPRRLKSESKRLRSESKSSSVSSQDSYKTDRTPTEKNSNSSNYSSLSDNNSLIDNRDDYLRGKSLSPKSPTNVDLKNLSPTQKSYRDRFSNLGSNILNFQGRNSNFQDRNSNLQDRNSNLQDKNLNLQDKNSNFQDPSLTEKNSIHKLKNSSLQGKNLSLVHPNSSLNPLENLKTDQSRQYPVRFNMNGNPKFAGNEFPAQRNANNLSEKGSLDEGNVGDLESTLKNLDEKISAGRGSNNLDGIDNDSELDRRKHKLNESDDKYTEIENRPGNKSKENKSDDKLENILIENELTENKPNENKSTANKSTEYRATEHRSTEHRSVENNLTENKSTRPESTENKSPKNESLENKSAENNSPKTKNKSNQVDSNSTKINIDPTQIEQNKFDLNSSNTEKKSSETKINLSKTEKNSSNTEKNSKINSNTPNTANSSKTNNKSFEIETNSPIDFPNKNYYGINIDSQDLLINPPETDYKTTRSNKNENKMKKYDLPSLYMPPQDVVLVNNSPKILKSQGSFKSEGFRVGKPMVITPSYTLSSYLGRNNGSDSGSQVSKLYPDSLSGKSWASVGMGSTDGKKMIVRRVPTTPVELFNIVNPPT